MPRDRNSDFEPQIVRKGQHLTDEMSPFTLRGLSTSGIQAEMKELYGAEVSPRLIFNVTNSVVDEVKAWQSRPFDSVYPISYFDCQFVKSREDAAIFNKAVYLALGINMSGKKELLAMAVRIRGSQILAQRIQ